MNDNQGKKGFACAPKGDNPHKAGSALSNTSTPALESALSDVSAQAKGLDSARLDSIRLDSAKLDSALSSASARTSTPESTTNAPTPNTPTTPESAPPKSPPIIFGPVLSRRFGRSLGVDLSPSKKQCNFDCVYCELHKSAPIDSMDEVLPPAQILQAIADALQTHKNIDVLTFTATGEPTLYPHLRELIAKTKTLLPAHIKTLILSNGSRFAQAHDALLLFDMVKFSIDAALAKEFKKIDRPSRALDLPAMLAAIERFARAYRGELIAEVLLVEGHNDTRENLEAIAAFLRRVRVARVDIGSIDRPSAYQVRAVSDAKLAWASGFFTGLNVSLPTRAKIASENLANKNLAREDLTNENPANENPTNKTHALNSKNAESKSTDFENTNFAKIDSGDAGSGKADSSGAESKISTARAESKNVDYAKVDSKNFSDIKSHTHAESKKSDSQKIDSGKRASDKLDFALDSSGIKGEFLDSSAPESNPESNLSKANPLESNSPESSTPKTSLLTTSLPEPKSYDASELCKLIATRPIECGEAQILFDKHTLEILDSLVRDKKLTIRKQGANSFYTTKR